jgi:hypothetical protein
LNAPEKGSAAIEKEATMKKSSILVVLAFCTLTAGSALLFGMAGTAAWGQSLNPAALQPHATPAAVATPSRSALLQLRQVLDSAATAPLISNIYTGLDSNVYPGRSFIIYGQNFTSTDGSFGQVVLNLVPYSAAFTRRYTPGQPAQAVAYPLQISPAAPDPRGAQYSWSDTAIAVTVPENLTGVMDQQATLQVVRSDGAKSNPFALPFTAAVDYQALPTSDFQLSCSTAADENQCTKGASVQSLAQASFTGTHAEMLPGQIMGNDQVTALLKNGWHFAELLNSFASFVCSDPNYDALYVGGWTIDLNNVSVMVPVGGTYPSNTINFSWSITCGEVQYSQTLVIAGPKGVPWK